MIEEFKNYGFSPEAEKPGDQKCDLCDAPALEGSKYCSLCAEYVTEMDKIKKEQKLESGRTVLKACFGGEDGNNEISISEDNTRVETRFPAEKSGDFALEVILQGELAELPANVRDALQKKFPLLSLPKVFFRCLSGELKINGKDVLLEQICPPGATVWISPYGVEPIYLYNQNKKEINGDIILNKFNSKVSVLDILHEAGHAKSGNKKRAGAEQAEDEFVPALLENNNAIIRKKRAEEERDAWAEALKTSRKLGLGIEEQIKAEAQKSLETYQNTEELLKTGASFTNKSRKAKRNQKGVN